MDPDLLKLLGSGGITAALLAMIWVVGNRMVSAIDRLGTKLEDHTKSDLAEHGETRSELAAISGMLTERRSTPVEGVPIVSGPYGPRPGTHR